MSGLLYTSSQNKLGARETLLPGSSGPGPVTTILQLRGRHEHAQQLNVILAPVIGDFTRSTPVHPCIAILEWGAGGAGTRAEIDFARGTALQIAASFVSISGRNDGAVSDGTGSPIDSDAGPQDVVAIISGVGSRAAFGRVTRTFYFGTIAAGASRLVPVPPFAKTFLITRLPAASGVTATVFDGFTRTLIDGGTLQLDPVSPRDEYSFASGVPAQRIDLFDRAGAVQIVNPGPVPITALQVAFELCL
jgi:hypothetical protein